MSVRVVVACDFALVGEGVTRALRVDRGIEVIAQACASAALELAASVEPDVVIIDLRMPNVGAVAVLDNLCASPANIRVLVITASEQASATLAVSAGGASYLPGCSTGDTLRQAVLRSGAVTTPPTAIHAHDERSSSRRGDASPLRVLQRRELDVLRLVVQRKTDNEIGHELFISPRTVQNHLAQIREKTGLRRRSELTRWAVEHAVVKH